MGVALAGFKWVASKGAPTGLANITPQLAQALWGNGTLPLALFTSSAADEGTLVYATGRDPDSGTRATAFAESGIGVYEVRPGIIETDMTRALPEAQRTALAGQIPLGRLGSVDDIAQAVAYLASDGAGYVTGVTLHVNGGMFMA